MQKQIEPIERNNIADIVFHEMFNMIIDGVWEQGQKIPSENELREAFSVSRDTVRQAIHRLNAMGLVQSYQGKGTYVMEIDASLYYNLLVPALCLNREESISVLEFEKSIQVECVSIVCKKATDREIDELQIYLEQMEKATDYETYFQKDMAFHCYLAKLTGNGLFIKSMDIISRLLHVYLRDIVAYHGNQKSIEQHKECYFAIKERNAEKAMHIMSGHCEMLLERMRNWLEKNEKA